MIRHAWREVVALIGVVAVLGAGWGFVVGALL